MKCATASILFCLLATGCARKVPEGALPAGEKLGNMAFVAERTGTLYVLDKNANQVVYSTPIRFGEKMFLYPDADQVILNGTPVPHVKLKPTHTHRFYFLKD